jgi:hypothetical protein
MRETVGIFFGAEFVVKYWHAKHENRNFCPQHGALNAPSVGLVFSVVTIAVSEPFLLPAAKNWCPGGRYVLAPRSYPNIYHQTTMTNGVETQHGDLNAPSARFCLARTGFKLWSSKNDLTAAQNPNFSPFFGARTAQKRLRNGYSNG